MLLARIGAGAEPPTFLDGAGSTGVPARELRELKELRELALLPSFYHRSSQCSYVSPHFFASSFCSLTYPFSHLGLEVPAIQLARSRAAVHQNLRAAWACYFPVKRVCRTCQLLASGADRAEGSPS